MLQILVNRIKKYENDKYMVSMQMWTPAGLMRAYA